MRISPTGTSRSRSENGSRLPALGSGKVKEEPAFAGADSREPGAGSRAFTLIELIVVLMALVIVAAAVVPALRGAGHQEDLTEVAARVAASARFARDQAVARQVPIVLTVYSSPAAVRLQVDTQALAGTAGAMGLAAGSGLGGMGTGSAASPASVAALPAAYAQVPLPPRCQARLEALPETLNGSPTTLPANGSSVDSLRFPPDGRTAGGMVVLTDDRGRTIRVVITPDTSVVQTQVGNG